MRVTHRSSHSVVVLFIMVGKIRDEKRIIKADICGALYVSVLFSNIMAYR